jgi:hypothetical protein
MLRVIAGAYCGSFRYPISTLIFRSLIAALIKPIVAALGIVFLNQDSTCLD